MKAINELKGVVAVAPLCLALKIPHSTFYRWTSPAPIRDKAAKALIPHPRALSPEERQEVLDLLHSERFQDTSPAQILATILDEGRYHCSERTMYRLLSSLGENKERRKITRHGNFQRPELLATGANQVWSWDITKLRGPAKWTYFYLYVILDIFSRYVVGWMLADRENGQNAKVLIEECLSKQNIREQECKLTIHSDRGGPMISKPVGFLLADLGITKSLGRPQVSNDNPFSEAQFKTLKYCPQFPERFGSLEDGRAFCRGFFTWYNTHHRHSGIGYYTPEDVHYGRALALEKNRNQVLLDAYTRAPERFVRKIPKARPVPEEVWINPPAPANKTPWPLGQERPKASLPASSAEAEGPSRAGVGAPVADGGGDGALDGPVSGGHPGSLENLSESILMRKDEKTR